MYNYACIVDGAEYRVEQVAALDFRIIGLGGCPVAEFTLFVTREGWEAIGSWRDPKARQLAACVAADARRGILLLTPGPTSLDWHIERRELE